MDQLQKNDITYVVCLHGNEILPLRALQDLCVPFIVGNPIALELRERYYQEDLNASFGKDVDTYEARRAKQILNAIPERNYVVDFHTTGAESKPFVIIVDKEMLKFATTTGIERIVIMSHNIKKGHALINHRQGISIEMGRHNDKASSYQRVEEVVRNIEKGNAHDNVDVYEVYDIISTPGHYLNFTETHEKDESYFPILANEGLYESQGVYGLKARLLK